MREKFGVGPDKVVDVQALAGDIDRQCAGRARHRRQDRGRADQYLWRSRHPAGPRRRDQAAEAPRGADRQCRAGAHSAASWCALDDDVPLPAPLERFRRGASSIADMLLPFLRDNQFRSHPGPDRSAARRCPPPTRRRRPRRRRRRRPLARPASHRRPGSSGAHATCWSRISPALDAGSRARGGSAPSPSTPRPPRSTPCWPSWSASRSRSSPASPAMCRSAIARGGGDLAGRRGAPARPDSAWPRRWRA